MSKYGYLKNLSLTDKQQKVLDYIIKHQGEDLTPKQIAQDLGYTESSHIGNVIKKFLKLGYLQKTKDNKYINNNK